MHELTAKIGAHGKLITAVLFQIGKLGGILRVGINTKRCATH